MKRIAVILLLLISAYGAYQSVVYGLASLHYYSARNLVDTWYEQGIKPSRQAHLLAESAAASARQSHPMHPLYADLSGQVAEWGALSLSDAESEGYLKAAKLAYLDAANLRPAWPTTWAYLAMIKWRLGEVDQQMLYYLQKADTLGPQKHEVHILYAELGLALYSAKHPLYKNLEQAVQDRILLGLRNPLSRPRIILAVQNNAQFELVCSWAANKEPFVYKHVLNCD